MRLFTKKAKFLKQSHLKVLHSLLWVSRLKPSVTQMSPQLLNILFLFNIKMFCCLVAGLLPTIIAKEPVFFDFFINPVRFFLIPRVSHGAIQVRPLRGRWCLLLFFPEFHSGLFKLTLSGVLKHHTIQKQRSGLTSQ